MLQLLRDSPPDMGDNGLDAILVDATIVPSPMSGPVEVLLHRMSPARGIEHATARVVRLLVERQHEVTVMVLRGGVPTELLPALAGARTVTGARALAHLASSVIRRDRVVLSSGLWASAALRPVRRVVRARLVHWEHSLVDGRLLSDAAVRRAYRWARPVIGNADAAVAVSKSVATELRVLFPATPVSTIYNLPPPEPIRAPRESQSSDRVKLVSIGALIGLKRHNLAVEMMQHLPESHELVILGDGPDRPKLGAQAERLGLGDRVEFRGHVADVSHVLQSADVLVHCSRTETFGLTMVEAAVAGVSSVVVHAPGVTEIVPKFAPGEVVEADPRALAAAVERTVRAAVDFGAFERAAVARDAEMSVEVIGHQWSEVLSPASTGKVRT